MLNGKFIGVKEKANVFCMEQKFAVRSAKKVTLSATALGVYFAMGVEPLLRGWDHQRQKRGCLIK